jgi:uncharacterized membrane protein
MEKYKFWIGIVVLLVLGFFAFVACAGFGMLIGFVFLVFPLWQIIAGTLVGSVGALLYILGDKK